MGSSTENPAGRLFKILSEAKARNDSLPSRLVWANILKIDPTDISTILLNISELINLIHLTKNAIQKIDGINHEIYLKPFTKLEGAFASTNFEIGWSSFRGQLDDATMVALQFCSDTLSRQISENEISKEELDALLKEVNELLSMIIKSNLPEEIKSFLIDNLENIRRAIITYRIRGALSLKYVLESNIGSFYFHREQIDKVIKSGDGATIFPVFFRVVDKLNKLVSFAINTKKLASPMINLLLGNDGPPE